VYQTGGSEDGVIVQQFTEHVEHFASGAQDDAGPIDAPLIVQMRIHRQGAVIIAKVAGAVTPHQGVGVERKASTVGRGGESLTPGTTEFKRVMIIDQDSIGGFQRLVAEEPRRDMLKHVHGDPSSAVAHGHRAQICAMGNQRRQECGRDVGGTGWGIAERGERLLKNYVRARNGCLWVSPKMLCFTMILV
jgi:hypothetical protein